MRSSPCSLDARAAILERPYPIFPLEDAFAAAADALLAVTLEDPAALGTRVQRSFAVLADGYRS